MTSVSLWNWASLSPSTNLSYSSFNLFISISLILYKNTTDKNLCYASALSWYIICKECWIELFSKRPRLDSDCNAIEGMIYIKFWNTYSVTVFSKSCMLAELFSISFLFIFTLMESMQTLSKIYKLLFAYIANYLSADECNVNSYTNVMSLVKDNYRTLAQLFRYSLSDLWIQ